MLQNTVEVLHWAHTCSRSNIIFYWDIMFNSDVQGTIEIFIKRKP